MKMDRLERCVVAAREFSNQARVSVATLASSEGVIVPELLERHQRAAHGLAWMETTVTVLDALLQWGAALDRRGRLSGAEVYLLDIAFAEYMAQMAGGLPMSANELVRPVQMGVDASDFLSAAAVSETILIGSSAETRLALVEFIREGGTIAEDFDDEILDQVREQYRRYTASKITPHAHRWHLNNALIPDEIVAELAELGTFGICIPPEFGGLGMGKLEMCVVTEELSRGWIGAGSLGTRSEIAAELIIGSGTDAQKSDWLPRIASGEVLPTAVFTEPGSGSDLGSLSTKATQQDDGSWRISGAKTWITHAARSDLMTILARSGGEGSRGLSMFLAPKSRGSDEDEFPSPGMSGGEIEVLGYRGMREYELAFDHFACGGDALLGGEEGQGFRQLMRTFEGARIQTAARGVGVAWRAYELALGYALERKQFGKDLLRFPRVSDKIVMMLVETVAARELAYFAARAKDTGRRCDIEAGMAKLLAARVAWTNADNALQVHGGNGYALEYEISRILCDARILNVFEGAAEIQANVIARGLLERRN